MLAIATTGSSTSVLGTAVVTLAIVIFYLVSEWKVFAKAGQPGIAAIVPIWNLYVLCKIAKRPGWWTILMFVPFVNIVVYFIVGNNIAKNFGKGTGFGLGLVLLPIFFVPALGFGDATYRQ